MEYYPQWNPQYDPQFSFLISCLFPMLTGIQLIPKILSNYPFIGFHAQDAQFLLFPSLYLLTTIMAGFIAWRREFHKYALVGVISNASDALLGCFLLWMICFPNFIVNWWLVANNKVKLRADKIEECQQDCLYQRCIRILKYVMLALMFGALLSPYYAVSFIMYYDLSLRADWRQPDPWKASYPEEALIKYADSQQKFRQINSLGLDGGSAGQAGYCDNFRNLYYGRDRQGRQLSLIDKEIADAFAGETGGSAVIGPRQDEPKPFYSYFFLEDPYIAVNKLWDEKYGLVAYPEHPGIGRRRLLWIGTGGRVLSLPTPKAGAFTLLTPEQSPLHPECKEKWQKRDSRTYGFWDL